VPSPSASEDRVNILDTLIKAVAMTAPTSAIHEAVLEWIARCREEVNRGERARDCLNRLEEARLKIERRAVYNLGMNMAEHQKHLREQVLQQLEEEQNKDCNRSGRLPSRSGR
jgi:hypothetical protein